LSLNDLNLLPKLSWGESFYDDWSDDEQGLKSSVSTIQKNISVYEEGRDFPSRNVTSRLSPYLAFGQVSPARVLSVFGGESAPDKFMSELGWREFSRYLQYQFTDTSDYPMNEKFLKFEWSNNQQELSCWQKGLTGTPIVDEGMRELWQSGWMHNRIRMITASFLVKHLLIDWREGARWFWDTMVDAEWANNSQGWQWVAGCGVDSSPYFRVFNPVTQSKKFDKEGAYIRRWVPELSKLSNEYIHEPWEAPPEILASANITLGEEYPMPMINLKFGRERALDVFSRLGQD